MLIHEKKLGLAIAGVALHPIHLRIYVPIHHHQVEPAVIVKVGEARAPAHVSV